MRAQEHSREFDDFTFRIGGKSPDGFNTLMGGPTKTYLRAAEAYLNDILFQKKASQRAAKAGKTSTRMPSKGKWPGNKR